MSDLLTDLSDASEIWLTVDDPLRQQTVQALQVSTGLSASQIEEALTLCFEELSPERLRAYLNSRVGSPRLPIPFHNKQVLHILPSNVFTAWVHGAVISLLCGYDVTLKPSMREPIFAPSWVQSLHRIDPKLATRVRVQNWSAIDPHQFEAAVAYGTDETLRQIKAQLPRLTKWAGYGQKMSHGVLFASAKDSWDDQVLRDIHAFHLKGCLSPQILWVEAGGEKRWTSQLGGISPAPRIEGFADQTDLLKRLSPYLPALSTVGVAGTPEEERELGQALRGQGHLRICPMGQMQRPPLTWLNGGVDLVNVLN